MKRSRSGSRITLRDRDRQSSLTIHVCFLRETVLVGTNHPNMEETGSLENPIPSGKCYLDLNRAQNSPATRSSLGFIRREGYTAPRKPVGVSEQRLTRTADNSAPIRFPNCASICLGSRVSFDLPLAL